ncbi:MAG: AEC family transporter [Oscillospiraceae bacterium]
MDFFASLSNMSVVLAGIAAGYLADKLGILGGETDRKLTKLILTITMPAMTLGAVATSEELPDLATLAGILEAAAAFYIIGFALAALLPRLLGGTAEQKSVWRFALCFSNVGFIGIPVCTAFLGEGAMLYAVILTLPFNLISYSMGPVILTGGMKNFDARKMFLTPTVVSSFLALVMTLLRLRPPRVVGECLEFVGDMTVPMSLLIIGSLLTATSFRQVLSSPRLWSLAAVRLVAMPMLLGLALRPLHLEAMAVNVTVLQMAMPVAANGSMLAMEYGGDVESMAQATFLTTVCAMVTVPLIATVLLV